MLSRLRSTILTGIVLGATSLHAQAWNRLPNGEWGYTHNLTTSAVFSCIGTPYFLPGGGCIANGNSLTLFSAASSMTITFTGAIQSVIATNQRNMDLVMGTLTKTFTGAPFALPASAAPNGPLFSFDLLLTSTSPIATSGIMRFGYTSKTGASLPFDCCDSPDYTALAIAPPPAPLTYGRVVYDTFRGLDITFDTAPQTITARVGLVPEPASMLLLGAGLLALGGTVHRRRRQHPQRAPH